MVHLSSIIILVVGIGSCLGHADKAPTSACKRKGSTSASVTVSKPRSSAGSVLSSGTKKHRASVSLASSSLRSSASGTMLSSIRGIASSGSALLPVSSASRLSSSVSTRKVSTSGSASRSVLSASRSGSALSPGASSSYVDTCPPHVTSTRTQTLLPSTYSLTTTRTLTETVYTTTVLGEVPTFTSFVYSSTTTITSTLTSTQSIIVIPASSTITVPTSDGFTPLLCLPTYLDPTVIVTDQYAVDYTTVTTTASGASTRPEIVQSVVTTVTAATPTTSTEYSYTTINTTRADLTSTVYAACASNNVSPRGPFAGGKYNLVNEYPKDIVGTRVAALDQEDCCAQCQASATCVASLSFLFPLFPGLTCLLYLPPSNSSSTCDAATSKANFTTFPFDSPAYWLSNGPCGQVNYNNIQYVSE